jgi:segregation and condensation protein A
MNIHINDFEGPLDLLLHLVKSSKMDIYEIEISVIIEQYLDIIEHMQELNIELASSYLVMAAELLHLKSKLLLNKTDEEDEESEFNTEEELKERLIEYQKYKDITNKFKDLKEKRDEVYTKDPTNILEYAPSNSIKNDDITLDDLINAFLEFKKREELSKPVETKITKRELSIKERTNSIKSLLNKKGKMNFLELFEEFNKDYVIVTFLSILNMGKNNEISIMQEVNFSDIIIEKRW